MRKLIFIIHAIIILILPTVGAYGGYPGECTYEWTTCINDWWWDDYPAGGTFIFDNPPVFNSTTLSYERGGGNFVWTNEDQRRVYFPPNGYSDCNIYMYYWEYGEWHQAASVFQTIRQRYSYSNNKLPTIIPPPSKGCSAFDPCNGEREKLIKECGGEENISGWSGNTGDPEVSCKGYCKNNNIGPPCE